MHIPILLYHSVPGSGQPADPLAVREPMFARHLDAIVASGREPVSIARIARCLRGGAPLPARAVAITFDDGYENTPRAIELLQERGLRASVYVTTGQLDTAAMLRRDQLAALARARDTVELGAHSVSHPHLDELSVEQIEREVGDSKDRLEQFAGREIDTFAYPFGSHDRRVRAAVIAAGFASAVAVKNALSHPRDDPWALARWTVTATTSPRQIERVLAGDGVSYAWRKERLRTGGYRAVRRLRRRLRQGASRVSA
jgi:peptidoglycan/xylan/chitin deacetylase (PgdA/CDA1 family)